MNARQKAKLYKKQLKEFYDDYASMGNALIDATYNLTQEINRLNDSHVTCIARTFRPGPVEVDEYLAEEMIRRLTHDQSFRQAVVFEGHTDPETNEYILEAKLTVVMPEEEE